MEYRDDDARRQQQPQDYAYHTNCADDLTPPQWWEEIAPPPVEVDDAFEAEWLDCFSGRSRIIWSGTTWRVGVNGVELIDGNYTVTFDRLWDVDAVKGAVTIEPNDHDELRHALNVARTIDAHWGDAS